MFYCNAFLVMYGMVEANFLMKKALLLSLSDNITLFFLVISVTISFLMTPLMEN